MYIFDLLLCQPFCSLLIPALCYCMLAFMWSPVFPVPSYPCSGLPCSLLVLLFCFVFWLNHWSSSHCLCLRGGCNATSQAVLLYMKESVDCRAYEFCSVYIENVDAVCIHGVWLMRWQASSFMLFGFSFLAVKFYAIKTTSSTNHTRTYRSSKGTCRSGWLNHRNCFTKASVTKYHETKLNCF